MVLRAARGPLKSSGELAQALLNSARSWSRNRLPAEIVAARRSRPRRRRVQRRKGRRALANFENLPVTHARLRAEREKSGPARAAAGSAKRSARRRAGRSSTFPGTSNASSMCARSMPAGRAKLPAKSRRSRWQRKRSQPIERGLCGAGPVGLHRHQQVCRLPAAVPAGRDFRTAGIRDFAGHAVGVVRGGGGSGRTLYQRMAERVRASHVVATDDTVLPMLSGARPNRRACGCTWATPKIPTTCSTSP